MTDVSYLDIEADEQREESCELAETLNRVMQVLRETGPRVYALYWPEPPPAEVIGTCREAFHAVGKLVDVVYRLQREPREASVTTPPST